MNAHRMSESIYVDDDSPYESVPETQALPQTSNPRQRPIGQKKKLMSSLGVVSNFKLGQVVPNPSQVRWRSNSKRPSQVRKCNKQMAINK